MADDADYERADRCLDYMAQLRPTNYREGVRDAVAECIHHMRGRHAGAVVDAVLSQLREYEVKADG